MSTFSLSIPKTEIANLPAVEFHGPITLVDSQDKVEEAVAALSLCKVVGFDTETKPSFTKGCTHKVALMQLSGPGCNYLFRLCKIGIPDALKRFIENPEIIKVGLSIHDDFAVMRRTVPIVPQGFVELQQYVRRFNIIDASLQKIYAIVFGERISKKQRLTNWEAPILTPQQQAYAALDSFACLRLYEHLSQGLFNPELSPWRVIPESGETQKENKA